MKNRRTTVYAQKDPTDYVCEVGFFYFTVTPVGVKSIYNK